MRDETEKEKQVRVNAWARTNDPSPTSYKTENSINILATKSKANSKFFFNKMPRKTVMDQIRDKSVKNPVPSCSQYQSTRGEKLIYKPMRRR